MKKTGIILLLLMFAAIQANAVLKEKDLPKTLSVLKLELEQTYKEQKIMLQRYRQQSGSQHAQLIDYMKRSEQISLMLYSQKADFTFDMAYACTEAYNLHKQLSKNNIPYKQIRKRIESEIIRYDSLITSLKQLPPSIDDSQNQLSAEDSINMNIITEANEVHPDSIKAKPFELTEQEIDDRKQCLVFAKAIHENLTKLLDEVNEDSHYYEVVDKKVEVLNNYASQKYKDIQQNIFRDGGPNYIKVLKTLPMYLMLMKNDFKTKYSPLGDSPKSKSEWRGPIVLAVSVFMLFYIFIATLLSNLILRWIPAMVRKITPHVAHKIKSRISRNKIFGPILEYNEQQHILVLALGILIFAVAISIVKQFISLHLLQMACDLMIDFSWLIEAILISLLIRLKPNQTASGINIYMPFLWMSLVIIFFRIVLIPNNIVNIICPPVLLAFTIWQLLAIRKHKKNLEISDLLYAYISLIVMVGACICSWVGYTLMAVQIIIWWTFQLASIQTITCFYDMMDMYENGPLTKRIIEDGATLSDRKALVEERNNSELYEKIKKGEYIQKTWFYDLVKMALVPIAAVLSVIFSIYWAASIFEMTSTCEEMFTKVIIEEDKLIVLSLDKLTIVVCCFFVFKYINYLVRSLYHVYRRRKEEEGGAEFNETLAKNIIAILVWGIYAIFALVMLKVPRSGIEIVGAGLATGMGFAMKDLLENFFYGISLMSGRLRVGDYIECDGIQGKVESITYQSTQITTLDGSVIAFLNTSLFNKNFKNLTRNHSYELVKVPIGIAYGSNVEQVRKLLINAIKPLCKKTIDDKPIVNPEKEISILFSDFGDNSVNLIVALWPLVEEKITFIAKVKETIYKTLNENGIEIPFPQQDVYIRSIAKESATSDDKQH